jgi:hypothetical protein
MSSKSLPNAAIVLALLATRAFVGENGTAIAVDAPSDVAGNHYVVGGSLLKTLDAFSSAANLQSLARSEGDELRVWTRDYMGGRIEGYVLSKSTSIKCLTTSHYTDGVVTIDRAGCQPWHKGSDALGVLDALSALNGKAWNCPVFDGSEVLLEGLRDGRRFALRVGNPWACKDSRSKAVMTVLNMVR